MISHRYLLPSGELCPAAHDHPAVRAALSPHSLAVMEARYRDGRESHQSASRSLDVDS